MLRALAALALVVPALAAAQVTITESSDFPKGSDQIINIAECQGAVRSTFAIRWTLPTTTGVSQVDLRISDTAGCPLTSSSTTAKTASLGTFTGTSGQLPSSTTASNLVTLLGFGCQDNVQRTVNVCAVALNGSTEVTGATQTATFRIDGLQPQKPVITGITAGDSALTVSWDPASGADRYKLVSTPTTGGPAIESGEVQNATSRRQGNLTDGTEYSVVVYAISIGGNLSAASDPATGTPVLVNDFWRLYSSDGGREQGGCGTTRGAGALSLLGLVAVTLLLRRRRRALPLVGLAAALLATPARAESPRYGTFDLKVVPYRPNIDAEFGGASAPYQDAFGGGRKAMFRAEVAWSILQDYGSLDLGVGAGYWQVRGKGRLSTDGSQSADTTALRIVPTSLSLTYRLDQFANRTSWFPLAPYARVAYERFNWWVTNGSGGVAGAAGKHGSGATNGWSATGGLAFQLDVLDRGLAREMDNDVGVNHTYLYAEATKLKVDDFGSKSSWDLSNAGGVTYGFGILFVF